MDDDKKLAVVFIDSLGRNGPDSSDLEHMPFLREELETGELDAGPVYVTPTVLGGIYTGLQPTDHGMPSVSRYDQDARSRPAAPTLPELTAIDETYDNVASIGLPFIVPPEVETTGNYWHQSNAMGNNSAFFPGEARPMLSMPAPAGDLSNPDENHDVAFNLRVDDCCASFGTVRNLAEMWDLDVLFFGYRVADSYAHYQHTAPEDEATTYRQELLEQIDRELKYLSNHAELFVFGDHGAQPLTEVFRINRWLADNGYLEFDIDIDWREQAVEYGVIQEPDDEEPGEVIPVGAPGVTIDEEASVAIGDDPFSSGITLLEGATETAVDDLIADLHSEDAFDDVIWTAEEWPGGQFAVDECPELYAVRANGTFVSGNLHPEKGGAELTRSGVHHPIGIYGATDGVSVPNGRVDPEELFGLIGEEFLGLPVDDGQTPADVAGGQVATDEVRDRLADLGYI